MLYSKLKSNIYSYRPFFWSLIEIADMAMPTVYKYCFCVNYSNVPTIKNKGTLSFNSQQTSSSYININTIHDVTRNLAKATRDP